MEYFSNGEKVIPRLKEAVLEGLYLTIKYGLLVFIIIYLFNFSMQTRQAAVNGEQAAIAIKMFQDKGYLPQFVNGQVPDKSTTEK